MGAPSVGTVFDSYRDAVAELVDDGEPFHRVESLIDEFTYLPEDERAALWLMAFSMSGGRQGTVEQHRG